MLRTRRYTMLGKTKSDVFLRKIECSDPEGLAARTLAFDPTLVEVMIFRDHTPIVGRSPFLTLVKDIRRK